MTKPTNTANDMTLNALGMLSLGPDWIHVQESQGAREAAESTSLPSQISDREQWEALGFVFGKPCKDDPIFCDATMPPGWTKRRTDHAMWTDIVDAAGNKRGSFFYKAAFYDRNAFMHGPLIRYSARQRLRNGVSIYKADVAIDVTDSVDGAVVYTATRKHTLAAPDDGGDHQAWWAAHDALEKDAYAEARGWLDTNKPDWKSPGAYWPT